MSGSLLDLALRAAADVRSFGAPALKLFYARTRGRSVVQVDLPGVGAIKLRPRDSDFETFKQVFVQQQYSLSGLEQGERLVARYKAILASGSKPLIIDAGANVGAAAIWFARLYPEAQVVAIEPEPGNAALCRANTAAFTNVNVVEGAIAGQSGNVDVVAGDKGWAAQTTRSPTGDVPAYAIRAIVARADPAAVLFIVKLDVEGFESDVFDGETDWVAEAAAIYIEPHDWLLPGKGTSQSLQRTFFGRGFEIVVQGENLIFVKPEAPIDLRSAEASHA